MDGKFKKDLRKIVADTSVIIDGRLTSMVKNDQLKDCEIIIPEFVIEELRNQANKGRETGDIGLEEIRELREISGKKGIKIRYEGRKPTLEEIKLARSGRIDALIMDIAEKENAVLFTSDRVFYKVAVAKGIDAEYFEREEKVEFSIEKFFDENTMSVHLKRNAVPLAKKGKPGNVNLIKIREEVMSEEEINKIIREIVEKAKISEKGNLEIVKKGVIVAQIENYRIVIATPPFSDSEEITAVRPLKNLSLEDYNLSKKLMKRLEEKAEGILIAGSPGHGKTTFAQALSEFYRKKGKIVKTIEHPRDLQVNEEITQYSALEGSFENTADILLLVRPDYTIFDEVRKTKDFEIFADLRLSGVGMIGVVHASNALDAIQRLIGRVELGIIPHVVDTVIFIKNGMVDKVYNLRLTVKVPEGMSQEDLARPVIEVVDFESGKSEYEIYTFGEENVVIPVDEGKKRKNAMQEYAEQYLEMMLEKYVENPEVEFMGKDRIRVTVDEKDIARLIGKKGSKIDKIERELGIKITLESRGKVLRKSLPYEIKERGNYIVMEMGREYRGKIIEVYDSDEFLFSATVGKNGNVEISRKSELGKKILSSYLRNNLKIYI